MAVPVVRGAKERQSGSPTLWWDRRLQGEKQAASEPLPKRSEPIGPASWLEARGCSSDGRALQSHCRGQGFDSPQLHQPPPLKISRFLNGAARRSKFSVSQVYRNSGTALN